ncbi:hypothetical protein TrLO_g13085 [Triparma laevis f. longispina]|uniref:phospholipase D n=1 Tax=Triparma laevis f. longispina TaxID=1714387 RepID=A0A9W7KWY6_9STRA|nr:hypothetical protein TrLO_g13085 [Triparma laevis f. longispina]
MVFGAAETVFLNERPEIDVISSTVTKALPRDIIQHTVKLMHKGHEWYITVQRQQLRDLFKKLKSWELFTKSVSAYEKYRVQFEKLQNTLTNSQASPTRSPSPTRDSRGSSSGQGSPISSPSSSPQQVRNPLATPPQGRSSSSGRKMISSRSSSAILVEAEEEVRMSNRSSELEMTVHSGDKKAKRALKLGRSNASFPSRRSSYNNQDLMELRRSESSGIDEENDEADQEVQETNAPRLSIAKVLENGANGLFHIDEESRNANKRLKRYLPIFYSPLFYRVDAASLKKQRDIVQSYLNDCMEHPRNRLCPDFLAMLEVGATSFDEKAGPSLMEGYVSARCSADTSDRGLRMRNDRACCGKKKGFHCLCCVCFCFKKRIAFNKKMKVWAVLKAGSLSFYEARTDKDAVEAIMFQPSTVIADQLSTTGTMNGALVVDSAWMCELRFDTTILQKTWVSAIKGAVLQCPYVERARFNYESTDANSLLQNEYGSHTCHAQWFVNGQSYFSHLYDALSKAKWQILISGWYLSADTYLKRPIKDNEHTRLDRVIEKACQRGVKVYIMIFHEPVVMAHNTTYTLERFNNLNHKGNLNIMRHGDPAVLPFWSHHDKHITIDQEVAFVGGIDVTFGRYENSKYRLRDDNEKQEEQDFPGADYANPRIGDVTNPENPLANNLLHDRDYIPRMPWRDIHGCIVGTVALDVAWHFIQRWNYTRYANKERKTQPALLPSGLGNLALGFLDKKGTEQVIPQAPVGQSASLQSKARRGSVELRPLHSAGSGAEETTMESTWGKSANTTKDKSGRRSSITKLKEFGGGLLGSSARSLIVEKPKPLYTSPEQNEFTSRKNKKSRRTSLQMIDAMPNAMVTSVALINEDDGEGSRQDMTTTIYESSEEEEDEDEERDSFTMTLPGASKTDGRRMSKAMGMKTRASMADSSWIKKGASFGPGDKPKKFGVQNSRGKFGSKMTKSSRLTMGILIEDNPEMGMGMVKEWKDVEHKIEEEDEDRETLAPSHALHHEDRDFGDLVQVKTTIVRSYAQWSAGLSETEDGIHDAYKQLIAESRHSIYIENQFFVSACGDNDNVVNNTIVNSLFNRILKAHADGDQFKVLVSIPLVPGMTGQIKGDGFSGIGCVMHFQFRTIKHGGQSLFERLAVHNIDPEQYIYFTGLRTHQEFKNSIETEMVYIHSKLMIVDDRKVIMGSANINDRSQMGYKDSEICMIVEDTNHVKSLMNGEEYQAGPFALGLRLKCWGDNLGLTAEEYHTIQDPNCEKTWDLLKGQSRKNSKLYEEAFPGLIPTNQVSKLSQMEAWVGGGSLEEEVNVGSKKRGKKDGMGVHSDTVGVNLAAAKQRGGKMVEDHDLGGTGCGLQSNKLMHEQKMKRMSKVPSIRLQPSSKSGKSLTADLGVMEEDEDEEEESSEEEKEKKKKKKKKKKVEAKKEMSMSFDHDSDDEIIVTGNNPMGQATGRVVHKGVSRLGSSEIGESAVSGKKGGGGGSGGEGEEKKERSPSPGSAGGKLNRKGSSLMERKKGSRGKIIKAAVCASEGKGGEEEELEVQKTLKQIKGILCEYPLDFLKDDFNKLKTNMSLTADIFK